MSDTSSSETKKMPLHMKMLIGLILGVIVGFGLQALTGGKFAEGVIFTLGMGGDIFINLLKMCIIPLVVSSLYVGVTNVSSMKDLGSIGVKTGTYYILSSLVAISIGLITVNIFQPGVGSNIGLGGTVKEGLSQPTSLFDIITRIIPKNPIQALADFDMLGIIFFTVIFSIFVLKVGGTHKDRITDLVESVYEVMMRMVESIISLAPFGVFCLVAKLVGSTGFELFVPLLKYLVTVMIALGIHFLVVLPLVLKFIAKKDPMQYFRALSPALLTAFSSASSAATLPLTMECVEHGGKVPNKVASMVLPLGATVNMDGTALYEGVAVLFIAQALGMDLSLAQQLIVLFTALLVSIGAAGIPHAGLVMMVIILDAVGLPAEATGMIWAVDRVVDMARTATNVWSDSVGAALISRFEGET